MGAAMVKHYHGDDSDLKLLMVAVPQGLRGGDRRGLRPAGQGVLRRGRQSGLKRPYRTCGYAPMVELLRYLEANGFTTYIASGGDRDFMRPLPRTCTASRPSG